MDFLISNESLFFLFIVGALGAITADILGDNALKMPSFSEKTFYLGFVGGAILGGIAGILIDGSYFTAMMGGFMGKEIIGKLANKVIL